MTQFKNLHLIGTSHISKQSIKEIKNSFESFSPDIVAVELDRNRVHALFSKKQSRISFYDIRRIGLKGFIFAVIGSWASKKLGKYVGVSPGSEMKTAITLAKKNKKQIALIDQPIEKTLKRFSKTLSWKERWNFIADLFNGLILRKKDPLLSFDISKVPSKKIIKLMLSRVKIRYPNIHKVLIEERNYYMARKLKVLLTNHPTKKILAIVGAGHEEDIINILNENEGISYSFTVNNNI